MTRESGAVRTGDPGRVGGRLLLVGTCTLGVVLVFGVLLVLGTGLVAGDQHVPDEESPPVPSPGDPGIEITVLTDDSAVYATHEITTVALQHHEGETLTGDDLEAVEFEATHGGIDVTESVEYVDTTGDGFADQVEVAHEVGEFGSSVDIVARLESGHRLRGERPVVPLDVTLSERTLDEGNETALTVTFEDPRPDAGGQLTPSEEMRFYVQPVNTDVTVSFEGRNQSLESGDVGSLPLFPGEPIPVEVTAQNTDAYDGPGQVAVRSTLDPRADMGLGSVERRLLVSGTEEPYDRRASSFEDPCQIAVRANRTSERFQLIPECTEPVDVENMVYVLRNDVTEETALVHDPMPEIPEELVNETVNNLTYTAYTVDINETVDEDDRDDPVFRRQGGGEYIGPFDIIDPPDPPDPPDDPFAFCEPEAPDRIYYQDVAEIDVFTVNIDEVIVDHYAEESGETKFGEHTVWPEITEPQRAQFEITCIPEDDELEPIEAFVDIVHWAEFDIHAHMGTIGYDLDPFEFDRNWNMLMPEDTEGTFVVEDKVYLEMDGTHPATRLPISHGFGTEEEISNDHALADSTAVGIGRNEFDDIIYIGEEPVPNLEAPTWMQNFISWGLVAFQLQQDMGGASGIDLAEDVEVTFLDHDISRRDRGPAGGVTIYAYDFEWEGDFGYRWPANTLTASTGFEGDAEAASVYVAGEIGADIDLQPLPFALDEADVDFRLTGGRTFGFDRRVPVIGSARGQVRFGAGATGAFTVGTDWEVTEVSLGPTVEGSIDGRARFLGVNLRARGSAQVDTTADFDLDPLLDIESVTADVTTEVGLFVRVFGRDRGTTVRPFDFTCTAPPVSCQSDGLIFGIDDDAQDELRSLGGTNPGPIADAGWSTDRPYMDTMPSVTTAAGETLLVYSSQDENTSISEGRDIVVATDGDTERITGDGQYDDLPAVADDGAQSVVAFRRATTDDLANESFDDVLRSTEIGLLTRAAGDTEWSDVDLVTDDDEHGIGALDVALTDDGILVAHERLASADDEAFDVSWFLLDDDLDVTASGVFENATSPQVDETRTVAVENRSDGTVRWGVVDGGSVTSEGTHDAPGYVDHAVVNGSVLLVDDAGVNETVYGHETDPRLVHVEPDGTEHVVEPGVPGEEFDAVEEMDASLVDDRLTVGYVASTNETSTVWVQEHTDEGWNPARNVTSSTDVSHTYLGVTGDDAPALTFSAGEFVNESVEDVYLLDVTPESIFTLTGTDIGTDDGNATVTAEVRNVGSETGTTTVSLDDGQPTASEFVDVTLDPGQTEVVQFADLPIPADGRFDVDIDAGTHPLFPSSSAVFATLPRVWIDDVELNETAGEVTVDVYNMGAASVPALNVSLTDDGTTLATGAVEAPPDNVSTVTLAVDPLDIDPTTRELVRIETDLPSAAIVEDEYRTTLRQPRIAINPGPTNDVVFTRGPTGLNETVVAVTNYGTLPFEESVQVARVENGTVDVQNPAGTADVVIPPGETEDVAIPLAGNVAVGDQFHVATPTVSPENVHLAMHTSTVESPSPVPAAVFTVDDPAIEPTNTTAATTVSTSASPSTESTTTTPETPVSASESTPTESTTIESGESVDVTARVEHTGAPIPGSRDIALRVGNQTLATERVSLQVGTNQTVVFENVTIDVTPGEYTLAVASPSNETTLPLTVEEPDVVSFSPLSLAGGGANETIVEGTEPVVSVTVTNVGSATETFDVTLAIENGLTVTDQQSTVELGPDGADTVQFDGLPVLPSDDYTVVVESRGQQTAGTLTVRPDVRGDGTPATDTTGDGLLDDLTGSGNSTTADVQVFFDNLRSPTVQENAHFFDFSRTNPDRASIFDVQAMFNRIRATQD